MRLDGNTLVLGGLRITFQRTLRIPDDGRDYPLPPGLGAFPLRRVEDYADRVPALWRERGGVLLPMYACEAMWLSFQSAWPPCALKVGVGKVCAVTGKPWKESLRRRTQDYVVPGSQPWLDGICVSEGRIRQFVAMPLGLGTTVEEQVARTQDVGGLQLKVFPAKPGRFPPRASARRARCAPAPMLAECAAPSPGMGLAAGGSMRQRIHADPHGRDSWDPSRTERVFVHLVDSLSWRSITGEEPPKTPVSVEQYRRHGLPWFELYDEHVPALRGGEKLNKVKGLGHWLGELRDGSW
jgi:hypothetical protein